MLQKWRTVQTYCCDVKLYHCLFFFSFLFLSFSPTQESEDSDIYASIQELRDQSETLTQQMENLELAGDRDHASAIKQELQATQERLLAKNRERELRK